MPYRPIVSAALTICLALLPGPVLGQAEDHSGHPVLGEVHFRVSCSAAAQAQFNEGMRFQHSFWHSRARETFRKVLEADPSCAMAYWGQALAALNNPFNPPLAANLRDGKVLLQKAVELGPRTEREAGYISALSLVFAGDDISDHPARLARYRDAMRVLSQRYTDDPEAVIGYALSLVIAASPTDKTYADLLEAVGILDREFARQPQHPGIAHYLIHAYDVPALAKRGLLAAQRYAEIAPDAPHALHMPSHIFTRVGMWEKSIDTNRRSANIALAQGETSSALHAMDYLVYAYLQTAQPEAAWQVVQESAKFADWTPERPIAAGYALTAIPARYVLERGDWGGAAQLKTRAYGVPHVDATTHFAQALGAARSGHPENAKVHINALTTAAATLEGKDAYWCEQVKIQRLIAEGWTAFAEGRRDQGLSRLFEAAEREGKTEKHGISPGPLSPAREQLAEMLLQAGRPAEALRHFEAVQEHEPGRLRTAWGAARSAELAKDRDAAARHYENLMKVAAPAGKAKPEWVVAKAFVDAP